LLKDDASSRMAEKLILFGVLKLLLQEPKIGRERLDLLQSGTRNFQKKRWADNWNEIVLPKINTA
jgi:hypothetical protein